jgi:hypothetical protein
MVLTDRRTPHVCDRLAGSTETVLVTPLHWLTPSRADDEPEGGRSQGKWAVSTEGRGPQILNTEAMEQPPGSSC